MRARFAASLTLSLALGAAPPAAAEFRLERQLRLEPGGTFTLDSALGRVVLVGDSASGARVTITSDREGLGERFDFRFAEECNRASLTIARKGGWLEGFFDGGWFRGLQARVEVHVPYATTVDLSTSGGGIEVSRLAGGARLAASGGPIRAAQIEGAVEASSSGGGVEVREVHGDVVVESSGGAVRAAAIGGQVRAESSGGGIELERVSGAIHAESSGGGVEVSEAGGRVEASSSGGPVQVSFAAGNGEGGDLSSSGGGVAVALDPQVALSLDASSSCGRVSCDLPVALAGKARRGSLQGTLNGGGAALRVSSSGGGVSIAAAGR